MSPGEALAITGPSGSGKSTLLHIVGTLDLPTSGTVNLHGENPFALSPNALAAYRNRKIGFIFQDHHLLPQCTVLENVLVPTLVSGTTAADETRAKDLLARVGLSHRIHHRPAEISGGERQRAAIARALIYSPPLLLADEPTGNLDRGNALSVAEMLLDIHKAQNTILLVVTHSQELARMLPRRAETKDGVLVEADHA
jgi:lipoprotein-releasing system ATP-binding protein